MADPQITSRAATATKPSGLDGDGSSNVHTRARIAVRPRPDYIPRPASVMRSWARSEGSWHGPPWATGFCVGPVSGNVRGNLPMMALLWVSCPGCVCSPPRALLLFSCHRTGVVSQRSSPPFVCALGRLTVPIWTRSAFPPRGPSGKGDRKWSGSLRFCNSR